MKEKTKSLKKHFDKKNIILYNRLINKQKGVIEKIACKIESYKN